MRDLVHSSIRSLLIALLATTAAACGGDDTPADPPDNVEAADNAAAGDDEAAADSDPREPGAGTVSDVRLATDILMRFVADDQVDARHFEVTVEGGTATIRPLRDVDQRARDRARALALGVEGVNAVAVGDELPVPVGRTPAQDAAAADQLLQQARDNQPELAATPPVRDPEPDTPTPPQPPVEQVIEQVAELAQPRTEPDPPPATNTPPAQQAQQAEQPAQGTRPPAAPAGEDRTYRIRRGDSLSAIARRELGDGNRWRELYEYNRSTIGPSPDGIQEGMILRLPPD